MGSGPPPLPPRPPASVRPPDNTRMRGCLIAAVVAIGLSVPVVAILAAIALPAYRDYTARAGVAQALADSVPLQPRLVAFVDGHGRCPTNEDPGFERVDVDTRPPRDGAAPAGTEARTCVIELLLEDDRHEQVDGHRLWLEYDPAGAQWRCSSEIEDRYLPAHCRG